MENIVRKGEIACNKQFLLFSQCFLPSMALIFHSKCTLKCRLRFVSIWTSLKFCRQGHGKGLIDRKLGKKKTLLTSTSVFPFKFLYSILNPFENIVGKGENSHPTTKINF